VRGWWCTSQKRAALKRRIQKFKLTKRREETKRGKGRRLCDFKWRRIRIWRGSSRGVGFGGGGGDVGREGGHPRKALRSEGREVMGERKAKAAPGLNVPAKT